MSKVRSEINKARKEMKAPAQRTRFCRNQTEKWRLKLGNSSRIHKDGEIKLMRRTTSYMEGIWEKKSDMHILRILEREDEKLKENKQCKKDNILSLRKI